MMNMDKLVLILGRTQLQHRSSNHGLKQGKVFSYLTQKNRKKIPLAYTVN